MTVLIASIYFLGASPVAGGAPKGGKAGSLVLILSKPRPTGPVLEGEHGLLHVRRQAQQAGLFLAYNEGFLRNEHTNSPEQLEPGKDLTSMGSCTLQGQGHYIWWQWPLQAPTF